MKINFNNRIKLFQNKTNVDVSCFISEEFNPNVYYFTGFKGFGILFLLKKKKPIFIVSRLDACNVQNKNIDLVVLNKGEKISDVIIKKIGKRKITGLDFKNISLKYHNFLKKHIHFKKTIDISQICDEIRTIKDNYELAQIKKACQLSCKILEECVKKIPSFKYEIEIKNYIDLEIKKHGYETSFDTLVASGIHGADIHYKNPTDKLKKGFLVIDFGIKVNNYCSDMTRTFYLGNPSNKDISNYNKVLNIQEECIRKFNNDEKISDIDQYVKNNLGEDYIHALGHGVGLEIHELPHVSVITKEKMKNNVIFTIEPGIYIKNKFGIRIEDTVLKNNNKIEQLTTFSKELIIIDINK